MLRVNPGLSPRQVRGFADWERKCRATRRLHLLSIVWVVSSLPIMALGLHSKLPNTLMIGVGAFMALAGGSLSHFCTSAARHLFLALPRMISVSIMGQTPKVPAKQPRPFTLAWASLWQILVRTAEWEKLPCLGWIPLLSVLFAGLLLISAVLVFSPPGWAIFSFLYQRAKQRLAQEIISKL